MISLALFFHDMEDANFFWKQCLEAPNRNFLLESFQRNGLNKFNFLIYDLKIVGF